MMYIGPNKVLSKEDQDNEFVKVMLENTDHPIFLKKKTYEILITLEPINTTELQQRKLQPIAQDIMKVLLDWDINFGEIDPLFAFLSGWINDRLDYAAANLWKQVMKNKPGDDWVPGEVFRRRTIGDINDFLTKDGRDKNNISGKGDKPEAK